jgi:glutathione synthase/RimK-type ligase-like ATP-grasp enzyme
VFSPFALIPGSYRPRGGAVFAGRVMSKSEQMRRLAAHGVPVPRTVPLTPDLALDPAEWGEYLIVKPDGGRVGRDVRVLRTADLPSRRATLTAAGMPPMLVQPYIPHIEDGFPTEHRTLTLLGRAIHCGRNRWGQKLESLDAVAADPAGIIASNDPTQGGRVRALCYDPEVIALGERAHAAFPELALCGVDIIRDNRSGALTVLEVNTLGDTWHFSSDSSKKVYKPEYQREMYAQFDLLERTAQILVEKTRAAAR